MKRPPAPGAVRVIGGSLRGSKLAVPALAGLRPTPQRLRETLFNWLMPVIEGARVLDLFAGSGALFLEALSRGAGEALALDLNPTSVASLRGHLETLRCTQGQVQQADALRYLADQPARPFDLAFLDPPFHQNLLAPACVLLEERGWLAPNAWIYTESESAPSTLGLPANWRLHREKHAGQVYYSLWQRQG